MAQNCTAVLPDINCSSSSGTGNLYGRPYNHLTLKTGSKKRVLVLTLTFLTLCWLREPSTAQQLRAMQQDAIHVCPMSICRMPVRCKETMGQTVDGPGGVWGVGEEFVVSGMTSAARFGGAEG